MYHGVPWISAALQVCLLRVVFLYKPRQRLNTAKFTLGITDSPSCLLTGYHMGENANHLSKTGWSSSWGEFISTLPVMLTFLFLASLLCLFPTLLLQFEFLILSICAFLSLFLLHPFFPCSSTYRTGGIHHCLPWACTRYPSKSWGTFLYGTWTKKP